MKTGPDIVAGQYSSQAFIQGEGCALGHNLEKVGKDKYHLIFSMLCYDGQYRTCSRIELSKRQFFEMSDYIKTKIEELDKNGVIYG
jgi:hypothetical protein